MYKAFILFILCLTFFSSEIVAQTETTLISELVEDQELWQNSVQPMFIDEDAIKARFESKSNEIDLPYLNGNKRFTVKEFSIYGDVKSPFPEIRTFKIYAKDDAQLIGRATTGPAGINLMYLKNGQMIRIYNSKPGVEKSKRQYVQEIGINEQDKSLHSCQTHEGFEVTPIEEKEGFDDSLKGEELLKRNGAIKRRYRTAIICTGEYYEANGNSSFAVRNLIIANLNDISAIFERDLAVEMYLAIGSPVLESSSTTDPFDPSFGGRTQQAQNAIEDAFPINRYDVGHVFHNHSSGDGWDTGGVAGLGVHL